MEGLEWAFLCEYALVDKANKLSMIGEFTSVYLKRFPAAMPLMYVVTRWRGTVGTTFTETVTIATSDSQTVAKSSIPVVEFKTERITSVHKFELLRLPSPGEYSVLVFHGEQQVGKERFFARSQGE